MYYPSGRFGSTLTAFLWPYGGICACLMPHALHTALHGNQQVVGMVLRPGYTPRRSPARLRPAWDCWRSGSRLVGLQLGGCVGLLALCVPCVCAGQTPTRVVGAFAAPRPCSVRPSCVAAPKGGAVSEAFSSSRSPCSLPPSRYCAANPAALSEEFLPGRLFSPQYLYELWGKPAETVKL